MTTEIQRQPGIPPSEYPAHLDRVLGAPKPDPAADSDHFWLLRNANLAALKGLDALARALVKIYKEKDL